VNAHREKLLNETGRLRHELNRRMQAGEPITDVLAQYKRGCKLIEELDKAAARTTTLRSSTDVTAA
jgi:hypothetical protein